MATTSTETNSMDACISDLETQILHLGRIVEASISRVLTALTQHDPLMAQAVIREGEEIDRLELEVHEHCLTILENKRPSGPDLRFVVAVLKINDSLERIGDLAENVAQIVVAVGNWERFQGVPGIKKMAEEAQKMVGMSLESLVQRNTALAHEVIYLDDRVDELYRQIQQRIEAELDRTPENANPLLKVEHVTRQFERMGDVATNIAEEVIYLVDGEIVRHR
ncbi:MAG: phosphate signaling complex protein PhoU [Pirellulaceae bacterium]|nr:phosphate signaling complex protein PhoU [Pirellulaceae bacterium]